MPSQLTLDLQSDVNFSPAKIYQFPSYKKCYSVFAYDNSKVRQIYAKLKNLAIKFNNPDIFFKVSPYRVIEHCYCYKNNRKIFKGDEKHIFRIRTLQKINELISKEITNYQLTLNLEFKLIKDGVCIYFDSENENQAEIIGTERLPLSKRLKIHIELLRQLKQGTTLKKAVRIAKKRTK